MRKRIYFDLEGDDGVVDSWMCSGNSHRVRGKVWRGACGLAANMRPCAQVLHNKFGFPLALLFCFHCLFRNHYSISLQNRLFFSQELIKSNQIPPTTTTVTNNLSSYSYNDEAMIGVNLYYYISHVVHEFVPKLLVWCGLSMFFLVWL